MVNIGKRAEKRAGVLVKIWGVIAWLTGVIVSLAVGFGMIDGTLSIPYLSKVGDGVIVMLAGWVVVVLALLGALLAIIDKIKRN